MIEYINKKTIINILHDRAKFCRAKEFFRTVIELNMLIFDIEELPAANVAPVMHGKWIKEIYIDPCGADWTKYHCSLCGRVEIKKEPYCNCGAKMDMEDENHD